MREYVYQYFDIQPAERWLVEDTVHVFEPSATPTSPDSTDVPTLQPVVPGCSVPLYAEGLKAYADALTTTLNAWAAEQESDWRVSARGGVDEATGLAMVRLDYTRCVSEFRPARFNSKAWQDLRNRFAEQQVAVRHEHQIIGFLGNEFYIVRPMTLMHWTRTAALNDADTFFWREQAEPNAGVLCMQQARKVQLQGADRAAAGGARETSRARGVARQRQESEASGGDAWEAGE
jgi:hypothetical protein